MTEINYTNWQKEREKLRQDILRDIRDQKNRLGIQTIRGKIVVDPRIKGLTIFGPFSFKKSFSEIPIVTFGQQMMDDSNPFIAVTSISKFHTTNTVVDGFYLALYPLISTIATQHIVTWAAEGKSSQYSNLNVTDSWTNSYERTNATHLLQTHAEVKNRIG